MGRRKKQVEAVHKHMVMPKDFTDQVEILAKKQDLSFTDCLIKLALQGLKGKTQKYKGFKEVSMSEDWTCFECGREFKRGRLAMYDQNTGASMCLECAIENELTTKAVVKLIIQRLRLKRNIKALNDQQKQDAEKYLEAYLEQTINLTEVKQHNKDEEITPKIIELIKVNIKLSQTTDPVKEKELLETLSQLHRELTSFIPDRKAVREKILQERQKLLEERQKQERKEMRKKKAQSYAT